jgi:hypothetical protein
MMTHRMMIQGWRVAGVGAVTCALLIGSPMIPAAMAGPAGARTPNAATGNTYGGVTPQGEPIVVVMTANRRKVVRALTVLDMTCTSGDTGLVTDGYRQLSVSKKGRFGYTFGPTTERNDDGTTSDFLGRVSGKLNPSKTKITGTWSYTITERDATGAVTDTCTSGSVTWTAKQ